MEALTQNIKIHSITNSAPLRNPSCEVSNIAAHLTSRTLSYHAALVFYYEQNQFEITLQVSATKWSNLLQTSGQSKLAKAASNSWGKLGHPHLTQCSCAPKSLCPKEDLELSGSYLVFENYGVAQKTAIERQRDRHAALEDKQLK